MLHRTRTSRLLLLLSSILLLGSDCDADIWRERVAPLDLPPEAHTAWVTAHVQVPEGTWQFGFQGSWIELLSLDGALQPGMECQRGCDSPTYRAACEGGSCVYQVELKVTRPPNEIGSLEPLELAGVFMFENDRGETGCQDDRNPHYVPQQERERLFKMTFDVYDVEPAQ